jgi:raffinose/stachyose/melibiose transport system permease protein
MRRGDVVLHIASHFAEQEDPVQNMPKKYYAFFTLPTLVAFVISFLVPFLLGIYLSFIRFTTVTDSHWVGVSNYIRAFSEDRDFLNASIFTVKFAVVSVVLINVLAFSLALLLTRKIKGTNVFRTVFFMPNLIGGIVLGYIWQLLINGVLINFGVDITYSANYGFWGLVVLMNWQMAGYMMVIYIAGIQAISTELIEAAEIDGANSWQILKNITIPLVMPSFTICTFLTVTNSFKLFDQNLALTAGAPGRASSMLALDIFNTFYGRNGYEGVGQAKAVIFSLIVAVIVLLQLRFSRSKEVEN